jgi:zinc transporter
MTAATNSPLDETDEGLLFAYALDGKGSGTKIGWREIKAGGAQLHWIHLDFSKVSSARWLRRESNIEATIVDALLDNDSRPRSVAHHNGLLVTLRAVNTNTGANPEDMVSIRIWIENNRIITTRRRRLFSVRSLEEELQKNSGPTTPGDFLVKLVDKVSERIDPVIDHLDQLVDQAEERFHASPENTYRGEFSAFRRQAMRLRRFLAPQRESLETASRLDTPLLNQREKFALHETADQVTRHVEELDLIRERAMVAQEELLARMAQEQNSRMYILAIVAAIFLPLSFLTGLMGMNVAGLPGTENPASFSLLALIMSGIGVAIVWFFRFKKWL